MNNLGSKFEVVKPPGANAQEPLLSSNKARVVVAKRKGCKKIHQSGKYAVFRRYLLFRG